MMRTPSPTEACLFEGALVRHAHRQTGFGVSRTSGVIKGFIEPQPGWHRALVAWPDEVDGASTEQYVDTDRLEVDAIGTLAKLVAEAGRTMTLHGVPVTAEELRAMAYGRALDRIAEAVMPKTTTPAELEAASGDAKCQACGVMWKDHALECAGSKLSTLRLGDVVRVRGFKKGDDRAHVVVEGPKAGRVKLCYCGQERWYEAKWYALEFIIPTSRLEDGNNPHVRRAHRWLSKVQPDPDGWKRIAVGRYGAQQTETVGHVALEPQEGEQHVDVDGR